MKTTKHYVVWKVLEDIDDQLTIAIRPNRKYIVVNVDEPYAKGIFEVLKKGEEAKGTWTENDAKTFEEFINEK